MELIAKIAHANKLKVQDFTEYFGPLLTSDSEKELLKKFEGIKILIPEKLKIERSEEKSLLPLSWTDFREAILCFIRRVDSSALNKADSKWQKSGDYSLNVDLNKLLDEKWELLYNHLGEGAIKKMLVNCQIFFPMSSTSYLPLHCDKAVSGIQNTLGSTAYQLTVNNDKQQLTFDLGPILYGKNAFSVQNSKVETLSETDICSRLVDDILELNSRGNLPLEKPAMLFLKNVVARKLVQRCSKNKTYSSIMKNIYKRDDGSGSAAHSKAKSVVKKTAPKASRKPKSCSEIRSVTIRKRTTRKSFLQEIPLKYVKKYILFHLNRIIPKEMFGVQKLKIIKNILKVLKYGKNQRFSLEQILDNISIGRIPCILKCKKNNDKHNLIAKLVKWVILKWVLPLISLDFYLTEKQKSFNKVHFYKKSLFRRCIFSTIQKMKKKKVLKVINKKLLSRSCDINRSHSLLRFVPKGESDLRYVIWDQLKNPLLEEVRILFKQMCSKSLSSFAPEVKRNFNGYWAKLATEYYSRDGHQPLYIVKVDISDAYGSIILTKLKKITEEFVKPFLQGIRFLTYRKFKCFTKQASGLRCYYVWRFEDLPPCIPNHAVLIPTTDCQVFQVSRLLTITYLQILLRDLKIGGTTYLLKRGIPHAGKLSSSFCQIYYDELDKQMLSEFSNNENEIFFRAVDDYLYVTPSLDRAKRFLRKMILGFKDFGVYTNSKKTLTNFGDNPSKVIPFYGYILNTETMEVLANYEIYRGVDIFYTMTFKDTLNPGRILREKMKNVNSIKLDRIILDSNFNKKTTILLGIFRSALLMSLRFKSIVNHLFRKTLNCHYLVYCVNTCANYICSRVERFSTLTVGEELRVSAVEARWMVLVAFMVTLPRKSAFCVVNRILKRQLWTCAKDLSDKPMQLKVMKDVIKLNAKENPFKGAH